MWGGGAGKAGERGRSGRRSEESEESEVGREGGMKRERQGKAKEGEAEAKRRKVAVTQSDKRGRYLGREGGEGGGLGEWPKVKRW